MNKTKRLMAGVPLLFAACLMQAQNSGAGLTPTLYDMTGFTDTQLNGTARYVGMGGAMSALGGDLSTINTNPAGIGLYRRSDVAVTGGYASLKNNMGEFGKENDKFATINQAGFVWSRPVDGVSLKYFNMGLNYSKQNNLRSRSSWKGNLGGIGYNDNYGYVHTPSQSAIMADMTNGQGVSDPLLLNTFNEIKSASSANSYYQNATDISWLTIMGIRTGLLTPLYEGAKNSNGNPTVVRNAADAVSGTDGNPVFLGYGGYDGGTGTYYSETRGGVDSYDFNMSFNFNDRVYFGVTLGAKDVNYDYYSRYSEDLYDAYGQSPDVSVGNYVLENWKKTSGSGFNLGLGLIVRPFEYSAFRFGVAVKTPTWYRLTDTYNTQLYSTLNNKNYSEQTGLSYDYRYQTPWSFNLSVGHTIGNFLALDAEYDYTDYTTAKLKDADGNDGSENQYIKSQLKAVHQFKIGAEWKVAPDFAIRAGYNYLSNVMHTGEGYAYIPGYNSVNTRTEYANMKDGYNLTFGLGYSGSHFYADLAYLYNRRNYDFYPFAMSADGSGSQNDMIPSTALKMDRQQVLLTLGYRF